MPARTKDPPQIETHKADPVQSSQLEIDGIGFRKAFVGFLHVFIGDIDLGHAPQAVGNSIQVTELLEDLNHFLMKLEGLVDLAFVNLDAGDVA